MRLTRDFKKNFEKIFSHACTVEENTWRFEVLLLLLSLRYGVLLHIYKLFFFETYVFHSLNFDTVFCGNK